MKKIRKITLTAVSWLGLFTGIFWSCRHDNPDPQPGPTGSLEIAFDNVVGNADLQLNTGNYTNAGGESFKVTTLNYYVTNIRLKRADGSAYVVPQDSSYFLVKEAEPASQRIILKNIPVGEYTEVSYLIGVDSLRNTMDVSKRTGVLDPSGGMTGGMYWDWNSGYIHFKMEGTSPQAPVTASGKVFLYHIGLFGGYRTKTINNLRTITLPFGTTTVRVTENGVVPQVTIQADVLKVFDGPMKLSIAVNADIMVSSLSSGVADNYARMFRIVTIKTN
ncbi:MbnP family protein [Larkinella sp.]|uniref:MbnP family protein n=1 Tax=Larkinella sp. TaxID=2034517 RepID=UPI003BAA1B8E